MSGPLFSERLAVASLLRGYQIAPNIMRRVRPRLVKATWNRAPAWRNAIASNAQVIFGASLSEPRLEAFGLAVLENMQRSLDDLVAATRSTEGELRDRLEGCEGREAYLERRRSGGGAVLISMHMGDFESAAAYIAKHDAPIHVLYARDRISLLERLRAKARARIGVNAHAVNDGLSTWGALNEALERNEVVAMQGDRVQPGQRGTKVCVLGQPTFLPIGPFKLAFSTGAALIPVFNWREASGRYSVRIGAPIPCESDIISDPASSTALRMWADQLGAAITSHPEQWLNVHAVWEPQRG